MTRPAIPPPACCAICGGDHPLAAHHDVSAAAHEWARAVLQRARIESAADFVSYPLAESTTDTFDRRATLWASQAILLHRRRA